jgi:hypothetical protein
MNTYLESIRSGASLPEFVAKLPRVPLASGISGLVVAALILMTPNPWFEAFIVETGLSALISAAEPPLGARARIVFALIAALLVTTAAWIAISVILGRKSTKVESWDYEHGYRAEEADGPVLRRADRHPDAPNRKPIMAGEDLGTPLDLVDIVTDPADDPEVVDPAVVDTVGAYPMVARDPVDGAEQTPDVVVEGAIDEPADEQPVPAFTIPLPTRAPEPTANEPVAAEPDRPEPETVRSDVPATGETSHAGGDLADLMARLETGLERLRARSQSAPSPSIDEPVSGGSEDRDTALRDALDALQRLSAKGA